MYVGEGTYGCVLRPARSCNKKNTIPKTITKIFDRKEAFDEEIKMHVIVKKIDPNSVFTVSIHENCPIDLDMYDFDQLKQCEGTINKQEKLGSKNLFQITYDYGGIDLRDACKSYPLHVLLKNMRTIFFGLCALEEHRFAHCDIKLANVVFDPVTQKIALIDFGMATPFDNFYNKERNQEIEFFAQTYIYWPPELKMFNFLCKKLFSEGDDINNTVIQSNTVHFLAFKNYVQFLESIIMPLYPYVFRLKNVTKRLKRMAFVNFNSFYRNVKFQNRKTFCNKIDVYALGVLLFEMILRVFRKGKFKITKYNIDFLEKTINLAFEMTRFDAKKRISPKQAYDIFRKISFP